MKATKKLTAAMLAATLMITSVPAFAANPLLDRVSLAETTSRALGEIPIVLDGQQLFCDQPPVIVDGRTLVPLRAIFEGLGASVEWNNDTRSVISTKDGTIIFLTIGSNILYKNSEAIVIDVSAMIIGGRTMVPVRAISEAFGSKVEWNNDTRTVYVTTNSTSEQPNVPEKPNEPEAPDEDKLQSEEPTVEEPNDAPGEEQEHPSAIEPSDPEQPPAVTPENPPTSEEPSIPDGNLEQLPGVDERENAYNIALQQLQNGYSYEAYYGFQALKNYKDSQSLKEQAFWLNQICFNSSKLLLTSLYDQRDSFELLSENEIYQLMPTTLWVSPFMQSVGCKYSTFNANGFGTETTEFNDPTPMQTIWAVEKGGLFTEVDVIIDVYGNVHNLNATINTDGFLKKEFRKITDGIYADINLTGTTAMGPSTGHEAEVFLDYQSYAGQGLSNYWKRAINNPSTGIAIQDENGLFS